MRCSVTATAAESVGHEQLRSVICPISWSEVLRAPAFIVNLDSRVDRLALSQQRIRRAGFKDVHRFRAIDGWDPSELRSAWQTLGNPRLSLEEYGFLDKPGAQACLLSHLALWRKIVADNIAYAVIFEDDVAFVPRWSELAPRFYAATPKDFDILYLGGNLNRPGRGYVVDAPTWCMHAYILTGDGARRLHETLLNVEAGMRAVDNMLVDMQWHERFRGRPAPFRWYAWNRVDYGQGEDPTSAAVEAHRGLALQDTSLGSNIEVTSPSGSAT